jgi:DUF438 domain-containing protein
MLHNVGENEYILIDEEVSEMSELINNREKRRKLLKTLIIDLHNGGDFDSVRKRFEAHFKDVSAKEISDMEQALIKDGMPVEDIQRLCDVHAAVFKGSIREIHMENRDEENPGHPVHTFMLENKKIERLVDLAKASLSGNDLGALLRHLKKLREIDKHYSRKENLIFPKLEKHNITGPPKVMWAIDDEVRNELKAHVQNLDEGKKAGDILSTLKKISEMIYKEDNILVPMILEAFSVDEWIEIKDNSDEIGYCFVKIEDRWKPPVNAKMEEANHQTGSGSVNLGAGVLSDTEIRRILNTLPVDITFVDANDRVKYFSEGTERIFPRPRTIIGREVSNCHPPASVHIVEKLVEDLKSGIKDNEDFWIRMGEKFVYIRYFAVRDDEGKYLGTLEFSQNIKKITELEGEKRLVT